MATQQAETIRRELPAVEAVYDTIEASAKPVIVDQIQRKGVVDEEKSS